MGGVPLLLFFPVVADETEIECIHHFGMLAVLLFLLVLLSLKQKVVNRYRLLCRWLR